MLGRGNSMSGAGVGLTRFTLNRLAIGLLLVSGLAFAQGAPPSGGTAGAVTSVIGTAPIVSDGATGTPALSITAATTSAPGSMSAADKTKLDAVTGTHTGTNTGDVTLGTANGLSITGQALSLAQVIAGSTSGAMSGADKTKLDAITGTHTGTNTGDISLGTTSGLSLSGQVLSLAEVVAAGASGAMSGSDKTKLDAITGTHTGTNTGDITIGTANGLSLSSQVLSMTLATTSTTGSVSATTQNFDGAKTFLSAAAFSAGLTTTTIGASGAINSSVAQGANAFTCTNTGCLVSFGNTSHTLSDDTSAFVFSGEPIYSAQPNGSNAFVMIAGARFATNASSTRYFADNGSAIAFTGSITSNSTINSSIASGSNAFTCTTAGCRLSLGNTGRYIADDGTLFAVTGSLAASSYLGAAWFRPYVADTAGKYYGNVNSGDANSIAVKIMNLNSLATAGSKIVGFYKDNDSNMMASINIAGTINSAAASGADAFTCTTVGCRHSFGDLTHYISDNGSATLVTGPLATSSTLAITGAFSGATTGAFSGTVTSSVASGSVASSQLTGAKHNLDGATGAVFITGDGTNITPAGSMWLTAGPDGRANLKLTSGSYPAILMYNTAAPANSRRWVNPYIDNTTGALTFTTSNDDATNEVVWMYVLRTAGTSATAIHPTRTITSDVASGGAAFTMDTGARFYTDFGQTRYISDVSSAIRLTGPVTTSSTLAITGAFTGATTGTFSSTLNVTGNQSTDTGLIVGTSGTVINDTRKNGGAIDFGSISTLTCSDQTQTLTGASVNDVLSCGYPAALEANLSPSCFVSATNTVTYRLCNVTVGSIDPASGTYSARYFH